MPRPTRRDEDEDDDDPGFEVVNDPPKKKKRPDLNDDHAEDLRRRAMPHDDEDEEDEKPRPVKRKKKKKKQEVNRGPLDSTFANTGTAFLILFALCCRGIALILALICLATTEDEKAKENATLVLVVDLVLFLLVFAMVALG